MLRRLINLMIPFTLLVMVACGGEPQDQAAQTSTGTETTQTVVNEYLEDTDSSNGTYAVADGVPRRIYVNGVEMQYSLVGGHKTRKSRFHHLKLVNRVPHGVFRLLLTDAKQHGQSSQDRRNWLNGILCQIFGFGNCDYQVRKVLVAVKTLEVRTASGQYVMAGDFGDQGRLLDLMNFQNGGYSDLGALSLAPGTYTGIRIVLKQSNVIEVSENNQVRLKPLAMKNANSSTIVLNREFAVSDLNLTMLKLDFDVQSSITRNFWGQYFLDPRMSIVDAVASDVVEKLVTPAMGGTLEVLGEIGLSIPANAVAADTMIRLRPTFKLMPHSVAGVYTIGQEYEVQPVDLSLNVPAQLSIRADAVYANALLIDDLNLAVHRRNADGGLASLSSAPHGDNMIRAAISALGTFVIGSLAGEGHTSSAACGRLGQFMNIAPTPLGVDLAYLSNACERHNACYAHGHKTYSKSAADCNEDLLDDSMDRCDSICARHPDGGAGCSQIDPASVTSDELRSLLQMYSQCQGLANDMHTVALATSDQAYPGDSVSTCNDYDQLGVSCAPATCTLSVNPSTIPPFTPSDLTFDLRVQGSVTRAVFDGTVAYMHNGIPTPVDLAIEIQEDGRELDNTRVFTAVLAGPGINAANPVTCSATVTVSEPAACVLSIEPDSIPLGGPAAALSLHVMAGYNVAQTDLRQEGVFRDVGLSAPDANGWRHFTSSVNPSSSRTYTGRVWDDAGNMRTCSDSLEVVP